MFRKISLNTLLLASLASAVALPPLRRQDGDVSIDGVDINFSGCDDINPKTGNKMFKDIANAWDDAIKLANAITEIDTNTDIGAFDYFGPNMQTEGTDYKILSVYNNLGSFGRNFFWGWRVNAFCPSQDQNLWRSCGGAVAFQWDTLCKDGRCPCNEREPNGACKFVDDKNWINRDADKSYINIQFCDGFFSAASLDEVVNKGKGASKEVKYNMNTYWENRGKTLFHELLHGATVGKHANENLMIDDLKIKIRDEDKPNELKEIKAYGPLNSKMLARTIRNENFNHVRQNDDNWSGYALGKYIQDKVGVYPILPLADGHVYDDNAEKPKALFLIKGDQTLVNQEVYNNGTLANDSLMERLDGESYTVDDFTFRPDSDYPQWYIEALQRARSGSLDGNTTPPSELEPKPGKSLSIAMVSSVISHSGGADVDSTWNFYTTTSGKAVGSCGETDGEKLTPEEGSSDIKLPPGVAGNTENPPWPGGSFKLKIEGEECEYKNDGTNPGRLFCPKKEISCKEDSMKSKKEGSLKCGSRELDLD
ncbi:hypothetical protein BS50DRAFT_665225 [Corynespora cassiicola Philippines]|uniref:Uncharacterized protein n=1 Tax=Corynespora cassiicola Philippines TaxID=1448308 RepID=A0A2T2NQW7_CORCC|nr:hypothetical protein BS50DRAFT_665225 [Corynespora cassiicola Philippines]